MRSRNRLTLAILLLSALTSAACARFTGKLDVDVSAFKECRKLTPRLQVSEIESDVDYRALAAEAGGAIDKGNKALDRRDRCDDKVIGSYATAKGN